MQHGTRWAIGIACLVVLLLSGPAMVGARLPQDAGEHFMLTIVYDSYGRRTDLGKDWGFACMVEGPEKTILFDTGGDGQILMSNIEALGLDPDAVDAVVLSHEHRDHIGGLAAFLERNSDVTVYVPEVYVRHVQATVDEAGARLVAVDKPVRICPGAWSTGQVRRGRVEQALALQTPDGLVVITGCAHPGVVQMVGAAREAHGGPVALVMGGFHLRSAGREELMTVRRELEAQEVRCVAPCHCSGENTRKRFAQWLGHNYVRSGVGTRLDTRLLEQIVCLYGPSEAAEREAVSALLEEIGARYRMVEGPELTAARAEKCAVLAIPARDPARLGEAQRGQVGAFLSEGGCCAAFDEAIAAALPEVPEGELAVLPAPSEGNQEAATALRDLLLGRAGRD
ncbi:MAG: MBL fold metallo-hydrolase [Candidatus Brocadiia bacterium]